MSTLKFLFRDAHSHIPEKIIWSDLINVFQNSVGNYITFGQCLTDLEVRALWEGPWGKMTRELGISVTRILQSKDTGNTRVYYKPTLSPYNWKGFLGFIRRQST